MMDICEIFFSIQGESTYAGRPCIFIRLSGCNLNCAYCDTVYAKKKGKETSLDSILDQIKLYPPKLVEITGGEPLMQSETLYLIQILIKTGYTVLLETNGSYSIHPVHPDCVKIIDVKCPSSRMEKYNHLENLKILSPQDQIKFVIANENDFQYMKQILNEYTPTIPAGNILVGPVWGHIDPAVIAGWICRDGLDIRLQLQLHKILWPHIERGV